MDYLILSIISIIIICILYKIFNWLLIERDPLFCSIEKDLFPYKPNFFARENEKLIEKDLKDQNNFALTEISNSTQIFDKTTQKDSISNNILVYNNKRTKS